MRRGLLLGILLVIVGAGLWAYSLHWPYYTDPDGPGKLSQRLDEQRISGEGKSLEWYTELRKLETPRKAFSDWGSGIGALGLGWMALIGISRLYRRLEQKGRCGLLFGLWIVSWLILLPGSFLYYSIRFYRFEYPVNGDSIMIPIYETSVSVLVGCVITAIVLIPLVFRRSLPDQWKIIRPVTKTEWARYILLSLWIVLWAVWLLSEIPNGDMGTILMLLWTGSLLLLLLAAPKKRQAAI